MENKTKHIIVLKDYWIKENTKFDTSFSIQVSNRVDKLRGNKLIDELEEAENLTCVNNGKKLTLKTNKGKIFGYLHKNKLNEYIFNLTSNNQIHYIGLKDYILVYDRNREIRLSYDTPKVAFCTMKEGKKFKSKSGCVVTILLTIIPFIAYCIF